jgi:hypothetical protein
VEGEVASSCYVVQVETVGGAAPALTVPAGRHSAARQEQQPMCSISWGSAGK